MQRLCSVGINPRPTHTIPAHMRRMRHFLRILVVLLITTSAMAASMVAHTQSQDPIQQRVETIFGTMTLEQKVGQLFLVTFRGPSLSRSLKRLIAEYHVGGIVLFNKSGNILNARQTHKLIADVQVEATKNGAKVAAVCGD